MNKFSYVKTEHWMISELGLSGAERDAYATVYSFSRDGKSKYLGGNSWIVEFFNLSRQTVSSALNKLVTKGYIFKEENMVGNVKLNEYWANMDLVEKIESPSNNLTPLANNLTPLANNLTDPYKKFATNNINRINKELNNKNIYGEFNNVRLTDEEYEKVKANGWTSLIEELSSYKASKGKQYKNDFATLTNWAKRKEKEKGQLKTTPSFDIDEISRRAKYNDEYDI